MKAKLIPISKKEATTVIRPEHKPYVWPELVYVMISDSAKVNGIGGMARNGDPLSMAYAVNFLESLYQAGYVVARPKQGQREGV